MIIQLIKSWPTFPLFFLLQMATIPNNASAKNSLKKSFVGMTQ